MANARGEVRIVGLFDEGDSIGGESLNGLHGALLVCCPDEAQAIGSLVYKVVDLVPEGENRKPSVLEGALRTMGEVASDLKDQRDAREEECAELRGHVRNLSEALCGKVRAKGEISRRVRAADDYLRQPRHSAPMKRRSPQATDVEKGK